MSKENAGNGIKWESNEELSLIKFYNKNATRYLDVTTMADAWKRESKSNRSIESIRHKLRSLIDEDSLYKLNDVKTLNKTQIEYDILREEFNSWLGRTPKQHESAPDNNYEKTLVLSDLHSPFVRWDLLKRIVDKAHSEGVKRLWLNGDTEEWRIFSRFMDVGEYFEGPDGKMHMATLENEIKFNMYLRDYLAGAFERIDEIAGNHKERPRKYFLRSGLHPELVELLVKRQERILYEKDFANIYKVTTNVIDDKYAAFYGSIGDCALCHLEYASNRTPSKQALQADEWFKLWEAISPDMQKFRMIIQGHSHKPCKLVGRYHRVIMEAPPLCTVMNYMVSGSGNQYPYPIPGYIMLIQDENGKTDINATNFHLYD